MKKILFLLFASVFVLGACGSVAEVKPAEVEEPEKRTEMLPSGVKMYLNQMTIKYSSAFTTTVTIEDKIKHLNEAITDINSAAQEIEVEYEEGTPPTEELLKLADVLLLNIEQEMSGEDAYDSARDAGVIIGDLSREYLDGELPIGIRLLIGKENADD